MRGLPADTSVSAAGHEPNGYFWESLTRYRAPDLADQVDLDCEGGLFAAYGDEQVIQRLRELLDPFISDGQRVAAAIAAAEAAGFEFDD